MHGSHRLYLTPPKAVVFFFKECLKDEKHGGQPTAHRGTDMAILHKETTVINYLLGPCCPTSFLLTQVIDICD